jgi:hypothetical protein
MLSVACGKVVRRCRWGILASRGPASAALTRTGTAPSFCSAARTGYLSRLVRTAPSSATKIASRLAGSVLLAFALIR